MAVYSNRVGVAFILAELGDTTMLATITLATRDGWLGTWVGSTLGMVLADALAIGAGALLGRHLPERAIRIGAAAAILVFGLSSSRTVPAGCSRRPQVSRQCRSSAPSGAA